MEKKGITDFLKKYPASDPVRFHMPGHKGVAFYERAGYGEILRHLADMDITEIAGADNKFKADGIIKETMMKYEDLYDVRKTYLLVNGTSGGLIASILSSVHEGGRLIMARNCHRSVFNALRLGNIEPVYAYPEELWEYGVSGEIRAEDIERLLYENPDAEAVIIPSPNYYGICSDIKSIAEITHRAGRILIVDQAHGAHLKLFSKAGIKGFPASAEESGADIIVNSTHKTLATFTQSAILNINSERIDTEKTEDCLQMIESSSPSYILMLSHDINADIIKEQGNELLRQWKENTDIFYKRAAEIENVDIVTHRRLDRTKFNIDMSSIGLTGSMLERELRKYGIFAELYSGDLLMCMTGIGTTGEDVEKLINALKEISSGAKEGKEHIKEPRIPVKALKAEPYTTKTDMRSACGEKELIHVSESAGRISASLVTPYPPGVPVICPGEVISAETSELIGSLYISGCRITGLDDDMRIYVFKKD